MAEFQGCELPEDLYYDVENDTWARRGPGELVTVGLTDPAQTEAGRILFLRPKKVGVHVVQHRAVAALESGKWAGPVRTPVAGTITEVNDQAVANPNILNIDPYGDGWVARIRPDDLEGDASRLLFGEAAQEAYRKKLEQFKIQCMRCTE
ncbi:MAG: glycine cleavage system protein H [Thermaerobacter sp.]|jgi:glycine cleavage system H protein|nr:glycine cleavage system protein H [Thermaerobacter sp.]MDA8146524.1 glycine cleavage system protein H [Thermaerobacter sp.]